MKGGGDLFNAKIIDLNEFETNRSTNLGMNRWLFPKGESNIFIEFSKGSFCNQSINAEQYLSMEVTVESERSAGICWQFWESEKTKWDISIKMGLLPGIKTRIALPFSTLMAKKLFLNRTPGKLKTVVNGRPVHLDRLVKFAICVDKTPIDLTLKIENVCILNEEPDYPLEEKIMIDTLGQKKNSNWPGKTKTIDEMVTALRFEAESITETPLPNRSKYGGYTAKKLNNGTGFFSLTHDGERYWLCDPEGFAFFSMGFDCISLGDDCNLTDIEALCENLPPKTEVGWRSSYWQGVPCKYFNFAAHNAYMAFGDDYYNIWADMTRKRLINWGCNTVACWSDKQFIEREKMPYVIIGKGYPNTLMRIFRDFPDVFSPEFEENSSKWAEFLYEKRDDPYLLGYFMSNEPAWAFVNNINIAAYTLASNENLYSKKFIIDELIKKYGDIKNLNNNWKANFESFNSLYSPFEAEKYGNIAMEDLMVYSVEMIRRYIKIPAEAARRVDPNHLNLGIRYAWLSSEALAAGCEYTDVFSFNCYSMDPFENIDKFSKITQKPVIIGEFHFGALDRGMDATGIRGVENQSERGIAYRRYMHRAASHPMCLGAHYFILYDQAYLGRFDGENYQIGVLDICSKPYSEFLDGIIKTHSELYEVAIGEINPTEEIAKEIPAISF